MQLILRPSSDGRLKEIIVTDSRFAIGRNEAHFATYDRSVIAKLSRRHARIFERDGLVYIADLHSSNGTTVNGDVVEGEPVQLQVNDEVQFGGLQYRVEHLGQADAGGSDAESDPEVKIVLKPARADGLLKPIVVSKFPFLVSRYSDAFVRYQESVPQHLSFISKKHAHFFVQHGDVFIEDLGSTNGTYVSGEQLTEQARKLGDGDTIAFGGDRFIYEVQVFVGREKVARAEENIKELVDGTIFVDDATNFFEIYMGAGDDDDVDGENEDEEPSAGALAGLRGRNTRFGRALRFFDEVRGSLRGGEPLDRRLRWILVFSLVGLAVGIGGYVYLAWPVQRVGDLLDQEAYLEAAELANGYLRTRPDDERLQQLATEAMLKALVPQWREAIADGRYADARQVVTQARQVGVDNEDDDELVAALSLATELSIFEDYEGGAALSVGMLADEAAVSDLVAEWDSQQTENARALSRIAQQVDGFDVFQAEFFRKIRRLRIMDRDLEPIRELRRRLIAALAARDTIALREAVLAFAEENPDVADFALLQADLRRYEAVEAHIVDGYWLRAHDVLNEAPFNTAPFVEHAAYLNDNALPDAATRAAYVRANEAWRRGNTELAFTVLGELSEQTWGADARRELDRNRTLLNELADLQANPGGADFPDRLFGVYGKLDPERDIFLRRALQPDFQRHSDAALGRAASLTRAAEQAWESYEQAGRLRTVHRLESRVSQQYRNLASLLSDAYRGLRDSSGIYRQLDVEPPESWVLLDREVLQEVKLQTGALEDLLVIEPEVRKAKLDLLPNLSGA